MASFRQTRTGFGSAQLNMDGQLVVSMKLQPMAGSAGAWEPRVAEPMAQLVSPTQHTSMQMMSLIVKLPSTHSIRRARSRFIRDGLTETSLYQAMCDFIIKFSKKEPLPHSIPRGLVAAWAQELQLHPSNTEADTVAEEKGVSSKAFTPEDEEECEAFWAAMKVSAEAEAVSSMTVTSPVPISLDGRCVALTQLKKPCMVNAIKGGNMCGRHTNMYASGKPLCWKSHAAEAPEEPSQAVTTAKLDDKDENGMTQLMWAAGSGDLDKVRKLVALGACLQAKDNVYGMTACEWAVHCGFSAVVDFITDADATAAKRHCAAKLVPSAAGGEAERCEHGNCNMELHTCCPHAGCGRRLCFIHMTTSACHEHGAANCPCIFCRFLSKQVQVPKGLSLSLNWKLGCETLLRQNAQLSDDLSATNDQFGSKS